MSSASKLYGAVTGIRNWLYDNRTLRARRLQGPVISVGNISAGGAGKTPFVMLLGELLKNAGTQLDVLSRGYGRQSKGVRLVDRHGSAAEFGDEPLLIARRLRCPVVVGESRYEAGLFAEKQFGPQLHILDDGFQHRALARDLDIVLITPEDLQDNLLPAGRLREPLQSLSRADVVVVSGDADPSQLPVSRERVWHLQRDIRIDNPPARPVIFCGIARPSGFISQLRKLAIEPAATKTYRDHHSYTDSDIEELLRLKTQNNAGGFICTEKDAVNLGPLISRLQPFAVARVAMEIIEPADALDTILRVIRNHKQRT